MKIIVGLGNPGEKYIHTRHNVGFMFVDHLLTTCNSQLVTQKESNQKLQGTSCKLQENEFMADSYLKGHVAKMRTNNDDWILLKPQTYMNKSGESVRSAIKKFFPNDQRPATNDLIVVHDDLDIPFGKCKVQLQGPKLHNGIESIENYLHRNDFIRIRIGVDNRPPENRIPGETYVLQNFTQEELKMLETIFPQIHTRFEAYLQSNSNCT